MPTAADLDVAVIGAGFSGIATAIALKDTGRERFAVFEKASEPGGVWRDNIYPGCRCDVPSQLYELEARPNPGWSRNFAPQPEIQAYLAAVAAEPGLSGRFRFDHEITAASFDAAHGFWRLDIAGRAPLTARALILGLGPLSRPLIPEVPGRAAFGGTQVHSARWDTSLDVTGRRVAVIGTGASAVQIVPEMARAAEHVYVVQRSPAWILPRGERRFTKAERALHRRLPALHRLGRAFHYWKLEFFGHAYQRKALAYLVLSGVANRKRRREVHDADLRRRLTPPERIGCKRAVLSDDYLPSFNRPNVTLLDPRWPGSMRPAWSALMAGGRRSTW